jgi:hypothetical protein
MPHDAVWSLNWNAERNCWEAVCPFAVVTVSCRDSDDDQSKFDRAVVVCTALNRVYGRPAVAQERSVQ